MGANTSANLACGSDVVVPQEIPTFKIVLVGDAEVGKTSIFLRYTKNQFDYSYQPTMVVNIGNVVKKVNIPYETVVSISLWDLPGREEMDLRRSYYTDVDAAIVVVDLSDPQSIDMAGTWRQDILNNVYLSDDGEFINQNRNQIDIQKSLPILLVGSKLDKIEPNEDSNEDVAESVKILEETAEQHMSACPAKENDGGVHGGACSHLRYHHLEEIKTASKMRNLTLLARMFSIMQVMLRIMAQNTVEVLKIMTFVRLERRNIKDFDSAFELANPNIKNIENISLSFLVAMRNFKKHCCVANITDSYKASTEECITGLTEQIKNETEEHCLEAHEDGGFLRLVIRGTKVIPAPIQKVIEMFNEEVNQTCKDVISKCPPSKVLLEDVLAKIAGIRDKAVDLGMSQGLSEQYCRSVQAKIRDNEARIKETVKLGGETMKIVDEEYRRIKTAMMW
eukprot:Seg3085.2 transcript_id=Seg3085.2/GoldUCD/mRNA.D3Y31 product="Ras-related protein RabC" protein_id=Seg3085.2/GoldUCD/D3Y31